MLVDQLSKHVENGYHQHRGRALAASLGPVPHNQNFVRLIFCECVSSKFSQISWPEGGG